MKTSAVWGSLIFLAVWLLITTTGLINKLFLPSPLAVFEELYKIIISAEIANDFFSTVFRTLFGFFIGCCVGVSIGLVMGHFQRLYQLMEFPVDFFRSIPATAIFPLFIVLWGLGDEIKIFVAAWASSLVVLINTIYGIKNVSVIRMMVAKTKKASFLRTFHKVMLPNALPYIFAGFRVGLSLALVVEIVAEMFLGSQSGLGRRIFNASSIFEMEEAYATVLVVGLLGYSLNKMIILLERRVVHWSGR